LWDGVTGRYIDNFKDLIFEIQRFQQLPRVNQAPFHVEHAILWHFVASVMPDVTEYPSDVADSFCNWNSHVREQKVKGRGVGKGITHECYHGFGHAVFYVVAKRQSRRAVPSVLVHPNAAASTLASFSTTNFRSTAAPVSQANAQDETDNGTTTNATSPVPKQAPAIKTPLLISMVNGTISVSTEAAVEIARATAETSSARIQFRPNIGFELTPDSMCEVYHLCKGATRKSDAYFEDKEPQYPFSHGIRICLEGVVHSVRLFSSFRHDKKDAIDYVMNHMKRCQNDEIISEQRKYNSKMGLSITEDKVTIDKGLVNGNRSEKNASNTMPDMVDVLPDTIVSNSSVDMPENMWTIHQH
jgi:hypothetical protein